VLDGVWGVVGGWWLSEPSSKVVGGWMEEEEDGVGRRERKGKRRTRQDRNRHLTTSSVGFPSRRPTTEISIGLQMDGSQAKIAGQLTVGNVNADLGLFL
jgi:hypothetical protein